MMKNFKTILLAASVAFLSILFFESCSKSYSPEDSKIDQTILIYMSADNNLTYYAEQDLEEFKTGFVPEYFAHGGGGNVLLVYLDNSVEEPKLLRYYQDSYGSICSETLKEYPEQDSSDPEVMREVLTYANNLFPSENNGLVLWSHGTGWTPVNYYNNPSKYQSEGAPLSMVEDPYAAYVKSFGYDQGSETDIRELAEALPIKYRFILFDACLMGGVEVAYELKDKCDYMIASAAEILAGGFPYNLILGPLFNNVSEDGLKSVCSFYYNYYYNINQGATVSLVKTSELEGVADVCKKLFADERGFIPTLDMDSIQGYFRLNRHYFYDLGDFVSRLASSDEYEDFEKAMDRAVLCTYATPNYYIGNSLQFEIKTNSGLSTYIPNPENDYLDDYYQTLKWNQRVELVLPKSEN